MEPKEQLKRIGKWIALKRARLGYSQTQFAEKAGISQQQLSVIEAGGNLTITTLLKILKVINETIEFPITLSLSDEKLYSVYSRTE